MDHTKFEEAFLSKIDDIRFLYQSMVLVDVKDSKPEMVALADLIRSNLEYKDTVISKFSEMLKAISSENDIRLAETIIHIIDFCMREFRWEEILDTLKSVYELLDDPGIKFEIEMLIRKIYDRDWDGGEFELIEDEGSIWDLVD